MNPFSYGTIVREPFFYDRKEECQHIVSTLSGGNNLVLFAPRRYGKTSLVFRAIEELEKMNFVCIYLFLGSRTHLLSDMFNNKGRAFYNSAMLMQINALSIDDSIEFLKTRFETAGVLLDDQTAKYLIAEAGNIPYYIQLLAAEVWQDIIVSTHKKVNKSIIDLCTARIVDLKNDYYTELYDRQSVYQKKMLNALVVSGENVFSTDYSKRFRLSAVSTTQKALIGLVESGVIEKKEGHYFIGDPFFKRFLLRYA